MRNPGLDTEAGAAVAPCGTGRPPVLAGLLALVLVTAAALGIIPGFTPAANAHTDLLQSSPGPGQRAGGTIDFLDLAFLEPVTDVTIEVTHNGQPVPGSMAVDNGSIIRFSFDEALTSSGTYEVVYAMTSYDLDATTGRFSFIFEPDAPQARRIGTIEPEPRNWVPIIATAVLIAALVGAAFVFLSRIEAKRRAASDSPDETQVDRS